MMPLSVIEGSSYTKQKREEIISDRYSFRSIGTFSFYTRGSKFTSENLCEGYPLLGGYKSSLGATQSLPPPPRGFGPDRLELDSK